MDKKLYLIIGIIEENECGWLQWLTENEKQIIFSFLKEINSCAYKEWEAYEIEDENCFFPLNKQNKFNSMYIRYNGQSYRTTNKYRSNMFGDNLLLDEFDF